MPPRGRIRAADIALVRERSKIDEIVGEHLQLKRAGGGSLKGLCPFHDEKSPSFQVTPTRNLYHCFGCGVGGDVISFVQNIDHLSFAEAVELLAGRANVELHYEDDGGRPTGGPDRANVGQRARLVAANAAAAAFFAEQLGTPEAAPARSRSTSAVASRPAAGTHSPATSAARASPRPSWSPAVWPRSRREGR